MRTLLHRRPTCHQERMEGKDHRDCGKHFSGPGRSGNIEIHTVFLPRKICVGREKSSPKTQSGFDFCAAGEENSVGLAVPCFLWCFCKVKKDFGAIA